MKLEREDIKLGDIVKVKKGIQSPDLEEYLMNDWQGEVVDIPDKSLVTIKWDSETILKTPEKYLIEIIKEGLDHELMTLELSEIEKTEKRHSNERIEQEADSKIQCIEIFEDKAGFYLKIFKGIDFNDEFEMYEKWEEYLSKSLQFPFDTEVSEYQERGRIQAGDIIKLKKIETFEDPYGLLGRGKYNRETIIFPICDLEALDKNSRNYEVLKDYCVWFANR